MTAQEQIDAAFVSFNDSMSYAAPELYHMHIQTLKARVSAIVAMVEQNRDQPVPAPSLDEKMPLEFEYGT